MCCVDMLFSRVVKMKPKIFWKYFNIFSETKSQEFYISNQETLTTLKAIQ